MMKSEKYTILYVDDEESNLRIFKNIFKKEYNIFTAKSAEEGIRILKNNTIDIILSDQRMPKMTGVDFLKYTLKKHPELNRILITGYTDFSALKNAINEAKIYQYVQKPWKEEDLSKIIKEALQLYKLKQENKKLLADLKETHKKLKAEKEKAEESNRLKSAFLSNISHEIRTPMNGIIGFSTILKENDIADKKRNEFLDIIIRSSNRLLKTIDDIVEISELETNQVTVKETEVEIFNFFEDLFAICKTRAKKKNITVSLTNKISPDNRNIITDEVKLQKITGNLIDNALKYTEHGSIEIICEISDKKLTTCIKDTGEGISPDMHDKIFERFRQEHDSKDNHKEGLGLGLAIVKENVKIMNGKIYLESEKGKGSVFTVEIPVKFPN